jgi:hypothetical protein
MRSIEHDIAATLVAFLSARGDRIACDRGMLVLHDEASTLVATLGGADYIVTLDVRRRTP